jgi:cytochrome P450
MRCAIFALLMHPEVQERARVELDSVLGTGSDARLPDYSDRDDLPYLSAIVSETLRFYPITPLGQCETLNCRRS